jgi:hypothetical protein
MKGCNAMNRHAVIVFVLVVGLIFSIRASQNVDAAPKNEQGEVIVAGIKTPAGEAYASYHKAAMSGDLEGVKRMLILENQEKLADGMGKKFVRFYQNRIPKKLTVLQEDVMGDSAYLIVEGSTFMGNGTSMITMRLEDNGWKVVKDKWKF